MDTAIVKDGNFYIACSLFPVAAFGWGNSEKEAICALNDNIYNYCNWLSKPLPKDSQSKVVLRYSGKLGDTAFDGDGKSDKKYAEVAMQAAFSYKCFIDSFELTEEEQTISMRLNRELNLSSDQGVIGYTAEICDSKNLPLLRQIIFCIYRSARDIFILAQNRNARFTDSFKFGFTIGAESK